MVPIAELNLALTKLDQAKVQATSYEQQNRALVQELIAAEQKVTSEQNSKHQILKLLNKARIQTHTVRREKTQITVSLNKKKIESFQLEMESVKTKQQTFTNNNLNKRMIIDLKAATKGLEQTLCLNNENCNKIIGEQKEHLVTLSDNLANNITE